VGGARRLAAHPAPPGAGGGSPRLTGAQAKSHAGPRATS
jgi:hypothetical protein